MLPRFKLVLTSGVPQLVPVSSPEAASAAGHDLIPDNVGLFAVKDIFNGEKFFNIKSADGSADPAAANAQMKRVMGELVSNRCMDLDGKFSDALRNTLFGQFGEDLGTRNMFRSRDVGMMDYAALAKCYSVPPNASVRLPHFVVVYAALWSQESAIAAADLVQ
jgi:hypothetical protein